MSEKDELVTTWLNLYETLPPLLGEGEKTIPMIANETGMDYWAASRAVHLWLKEGKIECVGKRRDDERARRARAGSDEASSTPRTGTGCVARGKGWSRRRSD